MSAYKYPRGYLYALTQGIVDFQMVADAKWFAVPDFVLPFVDYTPSAAALIIGLAMVLATLSPKMER